MYTRKLEDFYHGWFIGDFDPAVLRTKDFEVAVIHHKKGEEWDRHYHAVATEYNVLVSGRMMLSRPADGQEGEHVVINEGTVFVVEPGETFKPSFSEDCVVVTVKVPSIPGDKYVVED